MNIRAITDYVTDPTHRLPLIIILLLALGLLVWRIARKRRTVDIPEEYAIVNDGGVPREDDASLPGSLMLLAVGTYGVAQLLRLLIKLYQDNLDDLVGSILAVESDKMLRTQFVNQLPPVYQDRLVLGYSETFGGGFANRPIEWVKGHIERWIVPMRKAAADVVQLHKQRNDGRPAEIVPFISLGGHCVIGVAVIEEIHERLPEAQIIGCVDLPVDEELRTNFAKIKSEYERAGVSGWLLSDSLGADPVSADATMVNLLAGLLVAALQFGQAPRVNNIFTRALPLEPGGILAFRFEYSEVAAHPLPTVSRRVPTHYFKKEQAIDEVQRLIGQIHHEQGIASTDLLVGEDGRSIYDLVLIATNPEALREIGDHVAQAIEFGQRYRGDGQLGAARLRRENYHLLFASWSPPIDPAQPVCQVAVIRLQAVRDGARNVADIVRAPRVRVQAGDARSIAGDTLDMLPASQPQSTNGVEQIVS